MQCNQPLDMFEGKMSAAEILKMIEVADPADTAKLDEIDRLFERYKTPGRHKIVPPKYTRSRDALKQIRPEGWTFSMLHQSGYLAVSHKHIKRTHIDGLGNEYPEYVQVGTPALSDTAPKTEELAELHAIIQAIEYERAIK